MIAIRFRAGFLLLPVLKSVQVDPARSDARSAALSSRAWTAGPGVPPLVSVDDAVAGQPGSSGVSPRAGVGTLELNQERAESWYADRTGTASRAAIRRAEPSPQAEGSPHVAHCHSSRPAGDLRRHVDGWIALSPGKRLDMEGDIGGHFA